MNYHDITKEDMLNGDGIRVVLWLSGCNHRCKNCQNPITWDEHGGLPFDEMAENELFEALNKPYISGITFSGGDPLFPNNRNEVFRLIKKCRNLYPDKTIWLYTGYTWEEVRNLDGIENIDEIINWLKGRFKQITFVGNGAIVNEDLLKKSFSDCTISNNNNLSAYKLGLAGLKSYKNGNYENVKPLYLRKSQAERMLEK